MAHRFIIYDVLHSLNKGNLMIRFTDLSFAHYLEHCPQIAIVADTLINNGWVVPTDDNESHWEISPRGKQAYQRGHEIYSEMGFLIKIAGS